MVTPQQPGAASRSTATLVTTLLLSLGLAAGIAASQFHQARARALLASAAADLQSLAEMKARAVEREATTRLRDATVIARNPFLLGSVETFLRSGGRPDDVREWLGELRDIGQYEMVTLADLRADIRLCTGPITVAHVSPHLQAAWDEALRRGEPYLSQPHRYAAGRAVHSDIVVPLRDHDAPLGALIFRLSLAEDGSWLSFLPGNLGAAQAELLWREGDAAAFVAPATAVGKPLPQGPVHTNTVETAAAQGRAGAIRGVDVAGVQVVAASAPVGGTGLVLMVKAAETDILRPLATQVRSILVSAGLAIGCVLLASIAFWRRQRERQVRSLYDRQLKEQELLAASERHFRNLVESIPGGVWLSDATGNLSYISPQIEALLALPLDRALRDGWTAVVHPDDRAECERAFASAIARKSAFEIVFRAARADCVEVTLRGRAAPRFSAAGVFQGLVGNVFDVTDQHRAEQRIAQLSAAVEQSPAAIFMTNTEGLIEYVNPRFTEITGFTPDEAIGRTPSILISGETPPEVYRSMWDTVRAGGEWRGELLNRKKNGDPLWLRAIVSGVRGPDGVLLRLLAAQEDITPLKHAESELRKSADQLRRVVEANLIGTIVIEGDTIVEANGEFLRASGYSVDDVRAGVIDWRKLTPHEHLLVSERAHEELLRTGVVHPFQKEYFRKDGSRFPVILGGTTLDQRPLRHLCFVVDLTEVKQSELEIQRINAELRRLSGELLRSEDAERRRIARELHDSTAQLLTGIQLNLKRLEAAISAEDPLRPVFDQTSGMARQCTSEIRTISYAMHPPLLDDLGLAPAIDMLARGFEERTGIAVAVQVDREIGRLDADRELAMFRIVQEALTNVHRHSGSRSACVRLRSRPENLLLEIEDRGGASHPAEGRVGVGLLGMRERAKQFGGDMTLVTTRSGATVRVRMPVRA